MRSKKFRKYLLFYKINFGLQSPFRILDCIQKQISVKRLIGKMLSAEIHLCVSNCVKQQIKDLIPNWAERRHLEFFRCNHDPHLPEDKCIRATLKAHPQTYCVALGNQDTQKRVAHKDIGTPIIFMTETNILMLASPSPETKKYVEAQETKTQAHEVATLDQRIQEAQRELHPKVGAKYDGAIAYLNRQNPRAKGPNPLSCKKKAARPSNTTQSQEGESQDIQDTDKKKRKRKRKSASINNNSEPPQKKTKLAS